MTVDVSDLDLDAELAALARELHDQLHEQGDALVVHRPPAPVVVMPTGHRNRSRRAWAIAAAAAAVALIIGGLAVVGRSTPAPSSVAAEGSTTTATPTGPAAPWRLRLDPASGYRLAMADRRLPRPTGTTTTAPSVTTLGSSAQSVWLAPANPTGSPVLTVGVIAVPGMGAPVVGTGETAITVNGRPGKRATTVTGVENLSYLVADGRSVRVSGWGFGFDELMAILDGAQLGADGRLELAHPPAGLERLDPPAAASDPWVRDDTYDSVYVPEGGTQADAEVDVDVTLDPDRDTFLLGVGGIVGVVPPMPGSLGGQTSASVEAITVRGLPAMLSSAGPHPETYTIVWHDPATNATVSIITSGIDRAAALALVDHLVPVDDSTWQQLTGRCPNPTVVNQPAAAC